MSEEKKKNSQEPEKNAEEQKPQDKPVIVKAEAYKTIILYASRYANQRINPPEWKEIYGILIGHADNDFVYVERAEALTYGHSTDVQLDTKHYIFIDEIQQKLDEEGKGHYMVGWFHSHPGLDLFFSYIDLYNQLAFQQNNPDFVGLVFDHTLLGKKKEEKIMDEQGQEHTITKFDTGFEIFKITDVNLDINAPNFEANYHKVDYIVEGLNKFFFANVLVELSELYTSEQPLQAAYGEDARLESNYKEVSELEQKAKKTAQSPGPQPSSDLSSIPMGQNLNFNVNDEFFYSEPQKSKDPNSGIKQAAEQMIFEGNQAFNNRDAFTAIEKFRQGIDKYKILNDIDRVMELLQILTERCISTNHEHLAEEFAQELYDLAEQQQSLFYKGEGNYILGYLDSKKGWKITLEKGLKRIQQASIDYEQAGDYAGAGQCYHKIGAIYQTKENNPFSAALFYVQAIKSYNEALIRSHPLRKSLWAKAETLAPKLIELKDLVQNLIPNIENPEERNKIKKDFSSITYNL